MSLLVVGFTDTVHGQDDAGNSAESIAEKLANPNAALGSLAIPFDLITYSGDLPDAASQTAVKASFQPSLPYSLGEGTNLFLRPLIPVVIQQPVYGENGFENRGVELGDIAFDVAVGTTWPSKWITIGGVFGSAPTATDDRLGLGEWTLGPEAFVGKATSFGLVGVLVSHGWGLGSEGDPSSITGGQYFYTVNLGNAWQVQAQPTFSFNHNATSGNQLSLPLGTGLAKTLVFGEMPLKLSLQYWYYAATPEVFGPQHLFRLSIIPVVPLPW